MRSGSVGERAKARSEAAAKEQAFSALLVARIAFLAAGLAMAGLSIWGAITLWLLAADATFVFVILLVPGAFAAMSFLGAFYVVYRPRTWGIVMGVVWLLPILSLFLGARASAAHAAGVAGVLVGCVSVFRVRGTLEGQPGLWDEMLAPDAPGAASRQDSVRRFQRIALAAGLAAVASAGGYAWATHPDPPAPPPEYESYARQQETVAKFLETWNGGDARAVAAWFRPEVRDQIAQGLPAFVREAGHGTKWPKIGHGFPVRDEMAMTVDYGIELPYTAYLQTDWEWRDDRWTLMRIDFGSSLR